MDPQLLALGVRRKKSNSHNEGRWATSYPFHTRNWKLLLSAYLFKPASWVLYFPFNLPYPQLKSRNFYILGHWIFSPKIRTAPGNLKRLVTLNQYRLFPPSSKLLSCTSPWSFLTEFVLSTTVLTPSPWPQQSFPRLLLNLNLSTLVTAVSLNQSYLLNSSQI